MNSSLLRFRRSESASGTGHGLARTRNRSSAFAKDYGRVTGYTEVRTRRIVTVAVGTTITGRPPRRSVRARLRIRLLPWMNGGETHCLPHTAQSLGHAFPALCRVHV